MLRDELVRYLDGYLEVPAFSDDGPNGLQAEGRAEVRRVVTGVTASVALLEAAVEREADAVLVHHGILWKGALPTLTGGFRERVRLLIENDLNLLAYHLPLDAHPEVGNNVQLARLLGLEGHEPAFDYGGRLLGTVASAGGIGVEELAARLRERLGREPVVVAGGPARIERVGIVTGGAQRLLGEAIALGLDAYITGECSEMNYHEALEEGIHFLAAGHHATERGGPRALGEHLAQRFGLEVEFVDLPNPV